MKKEKEKNIPGLELINIPFADHRLMIYTGGKNRGNFDRHVRHKYPEWEGDKESDGLHFENFIFIEDPANRKVLLHELSHYFDYLYGILSCHNEPEFKAYLLSDILDDVLDVFWGKK